MNISKINFYSIKIISSLEYKEEFCSFLKSLINQRILQKVDELTIFDGWNPEYNFWIQQMPEDGIIPNTDSGNLQEESSEERFISPEEENLVEELQKLSPDNIEPLEIKLRLLDIVPVVLEANKPFVHSEMGEKDIYFGIAPTYWYPGHPILLQDVMRIVDLGDENNLALNLFRPIYLEIQEFWEQYYELFVSIGVKSFKEADNTEVEDVNNNEF